MTKSVVICKDCLRIIELCTLEEAGRSNGFVN